MKNFHNKDTMYISHLELLVSNIDNSLKLYRDILGFSVLNKTEDKVYLTANGEDVLVTLVEQKGAIPAQYNIGLYHFAILLPERKHLAKVLESLIKHQYPVTGLSNHIISEAIYLEDPDNNGIEIAVDSDTGGKSLDEIGFVTTLLDYRSVLAELDKDATHLLPSNTLIGHIHLHVNDLDEAESFFVDTLGYEIQMKYRQQASFISSGGYHHHLAYNLWNGADAKRRLPNQAGLLSYTIKVPKHDYAEVLARFTDSGLLKENNLNSFLVVDVNGVNLYLQQN